MDVQAPPSRSLDDVLDARIVIVDDDPTTLQLLSRILRDYPNVRTTTSPLEALKMVEERVPDLLLLDTQMPELSGFELWEALKSKPSTADIPAVFVTALLDPETEIKALSMGAVDFVSKPISAARLKIAVRNQVRIKRQTDSLRQQASMDSLTGVANRRSFDRALARELARAKEGQSPLSLLMVDVDHFKSINDNFGHLAGDRCLISVARVLSHLVRRPVDLVARYGGEEFSIILPLAGEEHAATTAAEIVAEVSSTNFKDDLTADHRVTVSVGWTTVNGVWPRAAALTVAGLIQQADEALLSAKEQGRNRVCGPEALSQRIRKTSNE
jgi:diguanylate cyclase (GGDEF)-like protein